MYHKHGIPTHCRRGHELTLENAYTKATGQICCKTCDRIRYSANKHRVAIQQKSYREKNLVEYRKRSRESGHRHRLKCKYRITQERYDEMYKTQNGVCILPSCGRSIEVIDHCHTTQRVRGLMCDNHNRGLGFFADEPKLLREAAEYLETFNGKQ